MPRPRRSRRPPKAKRGVAPGPTFPGLRGGLIPKAPPRRHRQRSGDAAPRAKEPVAAWWLLIVAAVAIAGAGIGLTWAFSGDTRGADASSAERLLPSEPDPWPAMDGAAAESLRGYHASVRGFLLAAERSSFGELRDLQEEVRAHSGEASALPSLAPIRPHVLRLDGLVDRVATEGERYHRDQGNVAQLAPTRAAIRDLRRAEDEFDLMLRAHR